MKKAVCGVAVLALALVVARVALAGSFTDPAGDSGGAPDITGVSVSNDAAGNVTITATTNQSALAGDAMLAVPVNTDGNWSTGSGGAELIALHFSGGWQLMRWDGSQLVGAAIPSASSTYTNGVMTFKINKADLGNVSGFSFYVDSMQFDGADEVVASDTAPDGDDVYAYTLTAPPPAAQLTLTASTPVAVPAKPVAGKAFSVRVGVTRGDTNAALASGAVTCTVKVGLKPLRSVGTVRAGKATCSMVIPATAHGKRVSGTIKVTFKNASVTKTFSYRVP